MTAETRDDAEAVTVPSGTSLWRRIDRGDLTRTLFVAVCAAGVALGCPGAGVGRTRGGLLADRDRGV